MIGCSGPQQSLPNMNIQMVSETIAKSLFGRNIFGFITLDLIAFPDPSDGDSHPLFWAVGLDCFINNYSAACFYFDFLVKGHPDPVSGTCLLEPSAAQLNESAAVGQSSNLLPSFINETRSFVYCPYIHHTGLEQLQFKSFFHLCRVDSISFDLEKRIGSTFLLLDSLQCGLVGVLTVGKLKRGVVS